MTFVKYCLGKFVIHLDKVPKFNQLHLDFLPFSVKKINLLATRSHPRIFRSAKRHPKVQECPPSHSNGKVENFYMKLVDFRHLALGSIHNIDHHF